MTPGGRRLALLVATGEYADPGLKPLRGPVKEAGELARLLADPDIGGFEVQVVADGSSQQLRVAIGRFFTEATRHDLLVLHISGHGVKDTRGRLHFAGTDTRLDLLNATGVPAEFVRDEVDRSPARQVVLWLDCCFSGAFPAGHVPKSGRRVDVVDQLSAKSGRGCLVMTASTHLEHAFETGTGHSPIGPEVPSIFTEAIISGLRSGDADLDADGRIEAAELYNYVYERVRSRTPHQTPTRNDRGSGPVYLAHSRKGLSLPHGLDPDLRAALLSKRDSLRSEAWKILRGSAAAGDPTAIETLRRLESDERARLLAPEPAGPEPPALEPAGSGLAGPGLAGPGLAGLEPAGSGLAGPGLAGLEPAGSGLAGPGLAGLEPAGSGLAGPGLAGLEPAGSGLAGPGLAGPEPAGSGLAALESAGSGAVAVESAGSEPVEPEPAGPGRDKAPAESAVAAPEPVQPGPVQPGPALPGPAGPQPAVPEPGGPAGRPTSADLSRAATALVGLPSPPAKRPRWLPGRRPDLQRELDQLHKATKPPILGTRRKARLIARSALLIAALLGAAGMIGLSLYLSADDGPVVPENGYELTWAAGGTPDGQTAGATVDRHVPVTLGSPTDRPELAMTLRAHGTPPSGPYLRGTVSVDEKAKLCGPVTILLGTGKALVTLHVGMGAGTSVAVPSSIGPLAGSDRISITIDPSAATAPPCGAVTLNFDNFVVTG
ncbi:Uncharacterized protein, contains caspase domain [Amycolatopsis australiensis]|uniref:Uncharacterized protein, contains caspase domain n=1 Tax=Amycolatopsis australiensis TaxID=546364 RepID=A0A1K1S1N0_9PSEU|nr:Uncharacterized protein, contains caspase domain [Amycolatopsis australiensis]